MLLIMFFMFFIQQELTFIVFLLNILCNLLELGKYLSLRFRNFRPTLVLTFLLNGGLNQMMFLFRFFAWFAGVFCGLLGVYSTLELKLLCLRASLEVGA